MPEWLIEIPTDFWSVLSDMAPYLLLGFLVAGILSVFVSPAFVERQLGGRGVWPVLKASAFGVPLPLCSCGVIPVAASLRRHGASRGATIGFLISTPQTGIDSIFVTYSLMGGVFAIFRPLVSLVSGILGGSAVSAFTEPDEKAASESEVCREACCAGEAGHSRLRRALAYGFDVLPRDIGRAMLAGLVVAALISALVPADFFAGVLGGGIVAMLVMMALGIPVYVCATASVPVAAALIAKGVSPGAALVFLMTGPATNAATIATIWKIMGRRTALIYLATVAACAVASGLALDYVFEIQGVSAVGPMRWMLPAWFNWTCAVALLILLGRAALTKSPHHDPSAPPEESHPTWTLRIDGMTCSHCADSVRQALLECAGGPSVQVNLASGEALVSAEHGEKESFRKAVEELGYNVKSMSENREST